MMLNLNLYFTQMTRRRTTYMVYLYGNMCDCMEDLMSRPFIDGRISSGGKSGAIKK